ncbi:MAG: histone deacetylase [Actinomycetia bacterium]|nr:histone deacetylase [Actinomycetes bacterium]
MTASAVDLVWYASYGSNLYRERFVVYLRGGTAPGGRHAQRGARDRADPRDDRPLTIDRTLFFRGESRLWGGGVAAIDHQPGTEPARGRAYLITVSQFEDVVAQESRRETTPIDLDAATERGHHLTGPGPYDRLEVVDSWGGVPVVTFTHPDPRGAHDPTPPSAAYLATIISGLRESHHLDDNHIVEYLLAAPGVDRSWTGANLRRLLLSDRTS